MATYLIEKAPKVTAVNKSDKQMKDMGMDKKTKLKRRETVCKLLAELCI